MTQPLLISPVEGEFNLPDESRWWQVGKLSNCWLCFNKARLHRHVSKMGTTLFSIKCNNIMCDNHTLPCPSSQDAVRVWQAMAKLVKQ